MLPTRSVQMALAPARKLRSLKNASLAAPVRSYCSWDQNFTPEALPAEAPKGIKNLREDMYKFLTRLSDHTRLDTRYMPVIRKKKTKDGYTDRHFVDHLMLRVYGGDGGNGSISLASVYKNEFAGPDGGDGGNGGHVVLRATKSRNSLCHLPGSVRAAKGTPGRDKNRHGACAEHLLIDVPLGTIVSHNGRMLGSLDTENTLFLAAKGGAGGKGNHFFTTDTDQVPRVAEIGGKGEDWTYEVELRTIADIGLIGFPNAGKSTLLRAMSRARPKVANYPFTTLNPHVGIVHFADMFQLAVADIPGLVEDAHKNKGLGYEFLRHIQRCAGLVYVLDGAQPEPWKQLEVLRRELDLYDKGLSERPYAVVANKIDMQEARENLVELKKRVDLPVIGISAKHGYSVKELMSLLRWIAERNSSTINKYDTWDEDE